MDLTHTHTLLTAALDEADRTGSDGPAFDALLAYLRTVEPCRTAENALAGAEGEIMGLRVSEAFFRNRAEVIEASLKRSLTKREQDSMAGCCPMCGVTVGEYVERIAAQRDTLHRLLAMALVIGERCADEAGKSQLAEIRREAGIP